MVHLLGLEGDPGHEAERRVEVFARLAAPTDTAGALIAVTAFIMGVIMHWRIER